MTGQIIIVVGQSDFVAGGNDSDPTTAREARAVIGRRSCAKLLRIDDVRDAGDAGDLSMTAPSNITVLVFPGATIPADVGALAQLGANVRRLVDVPRVGSMALLEPDAGEGDAGTEDAPPLELSAPTRRRVKRTT